MKRTISWTTDLFRAVTTLDGLGVADGHRRVIHSSTRNEFGRNRAAGWVQPASAAPTRRDTNGNAYAVRLNPSDDVVVDGDAGSSSQFG